jgi:hypothetical protein
VYVQTHVNPVQKGVGLRLLKHFRNKWEGICSKYLSIENL